MGSVATIIGRMDARARRSAWFVWLAGCGVYFMAVLFRSSLGVTGPQAIERLEITSAQLGAFVMLQLGMYAAMQIPAGLAIDRWGPRRVLLVATIVMGTAQTIFALATTYPLALAARGLLGIGDAAVYLCCLRLSAVWFPKRRYALLAMLSGLFGMAGNLTATVPLTWALGHLGWTQVFAVTGVTAIAYSLLLLRPAIAAPYRQQDEAQEPASGSGTSGGSRSRTHGVRGLASEIAATWRGGPSGPGTQVGFWTHQATMASGAVLAMVWGFPYLTEGLGYSDQEASTQLLVFVSATLVLSFVIGPWAGRRPGARMPLALVLCVAIVLAWTVLVTWPGGEPPRWAVTATFVIIATGGPASQIGFHLARDYSPLNRVSTATGVVNSGGFLSAMLGAVTVGLILDALSGDAAPTLTDYRWALSSLGAITLFSTLAMLRALLRLRRRALQRIDAGDPVVVHVTAHWWDGEHLRSRRPTED